MLHCYKDPLKSDPQDLVFSTRIQASELLAHFKVTLPQKNCDTLEFAFHLHLLIPFFF